MDRHDSYTALADIPTMTGIVSVRGLLPPTGTMRFPEGLRDIFHEPPISLAPEADSEFDVSTRLGCLVWRITVFALPNRLEGKSIPQRMPLPMRAPPMFLTR